MPDSLSNQVVIIMGGGGGLGRTLAVRLAEEGASLGLLDENREALRDTSETVSARGGRVVFSSGDVAREKHVSQFVSTVLESWGKVDGLVNCAGVTGPTAPLWKVEPEAWERVFAVNVTGAYLACRAALPSMIERKEGVIVNIASVAGFVAYPLRCPYAASKWALIGLTQSLAQEVGKHGIRVNVLCPGPVEGERIESVFADRAKEIGGSIASLRREFSQASALGRLVVPKEVAETALFLLSSAGSGITGQAVRVCGGFRDVIR